MERNKALWAAGWGQEAGSAGIGLPRCETYDGRVDPIQRKAAVGDNPIYFTPGDRVMAFCVLTKPWASPENRPWRLLIGELPALDKRGRTRKWASSQAALAEARRIERDALSIPRRVRVGTKVAPQARTAA